MRCTSCGAEGAEVCERCREREQGQRELARRAELAWLYTCAHRAVKLARVYAASDGKDGLRARGCLAQVKVYRRDIRGLRLAASTPAMPGLIKGRTLVAEPHKRASSGGG